MMNDLKKKPCHKCPYALGLIQTVKNPCPQCMENGYRSYQWFQKSAGVDSGAGPRHGNRIE